MVRVAAVQEPGVYFDRDGSIARAVELIERAAADGVELMVFPEAWLPGYPDFVWGLPPSNEPGDVERLYLQLFANSVDLASDQLAPIQAAAREHHVVVVMGINERASEMSAGTLFNTAVTIDATGEILNVHRKVMPTNGERTVWGFGDGRGLNVVDTAVGRVGVLLCWENLMPLARAAIYSQNVEIYCAPTADHRETWLATMQHIGREGSTWVIGVGPAVEDRDIPDDLIARDRVLSERRGRSGTHATREGSPDRRHRPHGGPGGPTDIRQRRPLLTARHLPAQREPFRTNASEPAAGRRVVLPS
jgi:nitrilase